MSQNRPSRRDLLSTALTGAAVGAAALSAPSLFVGAAFAGDKDKKGKGAGKDEAPKSAEAPKAAEPKAGPIVLPPLPYADTALAPVISQNTISFHHGKHHKAYVDNANKLLENRPFADKPVVDIIRETYGKADLVGIYNNVAQAWNHDFYWYSMRPGGGGKPTGRIADRIQSDLGGYDAFREAFTKTALGRFASGWAWLVVKDGKLAVVDTMNADTPWTAGQKPLLVIDVWEHAYYLDYQNKRADYVAAWLDKLVNWEFAEKNLG